MGGSSIFWIFVMSFVSGIAMVWLYAAIRPRFGPGPKTALITGLAVWIFAWLWGYSITLAKGLYPTKLVLIATIWGLFEVPIASLAGAWCYKVE